MADFFLSGPPKSGLEGLGQSTYLPTYPMFAHFWNALYIYIPSGAKGSDGRAVMAAGDVINRLMKS